MFDSEVDPGGDQGQLGAPALLRCPFHRLHHYALLFHVEMLEVLALGIGSRLAAGTTREISVSLAGALIEQPHRTGR